MPRPASTRAAIVVVMTMIISFCLIGMLRKLGTVFLFPARNGHVQQFGAEFEAGIFGGNSIDPEPHAAILDNESDHTSVMQETFFLANGQNGSQSRQHFEALFFRIGEKQHLAGLQPRRASDSSHRQASAVYVFPPQHPVERAAKRIVSE